MAKGNDKTRCVTCGKEKAAFKCRGCLQDFCYNHTIDHHEELRRQLEEIEVDRDLFQQALTEQTVNPQKHPLILQIDKWERDSINKIRQSAAEARETLLQYPNGHMKHIEVKLNRLTDQLRQSREEDDFFETDLCRWKEELTRLAEELAKPLNINLRHHTIPLVTKIFVDVLPSEYSYRT